MDHRPSVDERITISPTRPLHTGLTWLDKPGEHKMSKKRLVVIGGDAAGMTAASRARRFNTELEITAFERGIYTSYSA